MIASQRVTAAESLEQNEDEENKSFEGPQIEDQEMLEASNDSKDNIVQESDSVLQAPSQNIEPEMMVDD